jgi:outer membrane lipopolysaccharide assembly protein LptE/RlpB
MFTDKERESPFLLKPVHESAINQLWRQIWKLEERIRRLEQGPKQPANVRRPEDV